MFDERINTGALQANRVQHSTWRFRHAWSSSTRTSIKHHTLGDNPTDVRDVKELIELFTRSRTTRSGKNWQRGFKACDRSRHVNCRKVYRWANRTTSDQSTRH